MRREREAQTAAAARNRDALPLRHARADFSRQPGGSVLAGEAGLLGGGTEGNRRLTSQTGALLLVLLAILGVTIIRIGQLLWVHLFVGVLLLGPVALKLASTGYRFTRYYAGNARYRRVGPPPTLLRMLAPLVVLTTIGVFATGVILLLAGPSARETFLPLHKYLFFAWLACFAVHVLGHVAELPSALDAGGRRWPGVAVSARSYAEATDRIPGMRHALPFDGEPAWDGYGTGRAGRVLAIGGVLIGGLVLALVSISWFGPWLRSFG